MSDGFFPNYTDENKEIDNDIEEGIIKSPKQIRVLEFLKENDGVYIGDLEIYTDTTRAVIKTLEKNEYIQIFEQNVKIHILFIF